MSSILMIRPSSFAFNAQTAVNNVFQIKGNAKNVHKLALQQFEDFVRKLRDADIDVIVVDDSPEPHTPDSIFPNNWITFHDDGTVILYPMYAENRRLERKPEVLNRIRQMYTIEKTIDLTGFEKENRFLEGTGSMVLDRENRIAYACLSPRTDKDLVDRFCEEMNYRGVTFHGIDRNGRPIYHTNVMMCVGDKFVVICLECVDDEKERLNIAHAIVESGKELMAITSEQMNRFAGNMLQVENRKGKKFLVMSSQAYDALTPEQLMRLRAYNEIIHSPLDVIESNGGGSARCMMAEVFLPSASQPGSGKNLL